MQRFKSILAVLTEDSLSEVALERALHLAKMNDAALTLVDIIDAAPGELGRLMEAISGRRGSAIEDDVIAYHRDRLAQLTERARKDGVEVTEAVLQGSPFVEVIRMVLREGHDIVIKGASTAANGHGTLKGFDMHLLRKCPCPVWMLMGPDHGRFGKVLATVDPGPQGDATREKLDCLVLDLATSLAAMDGADMKVLHAWELHEEQALRHGRYSKGSAGEVDVLLEREAEAATDRMHQLMTDYAQVPANKVVLKKGAPADVIADFAAQDGTDVIVMGTVGRTGVAGFIVGNTAEAVLGRVQCSVIAVKPEGFESPVTLVGGG